MRPTRLLATSAALFLGACPEPFPPCATGFLGTPARPLEMELTALAADHTTVRPLGPCDTVDVLLPPQGGRVIFVGVRASNLDGCGVELNAKVIDPETGEVLGAAADVRTLNLVPIEGRPGWGESSRAGSGPTIGAANFANIPLCPNFAARDVEQVQRLRVALRERGGRSAEMEIPIVPRCPGETQEERAYCACQCAADYASGRCADLGAWGAPDGGGPDCAPPSDGG